MKLTIKEIKYIRQSLEYRSQYYEDKPKYKEYLNELKPIIILKRRKLINFYLELKKEELLPYDKRANSNNSCAYFGLFSLDISR